MTVEQSTTVALHPFFGYIALPDDCFLGRRIFKKMFYEHAHLRSKDKRRLQEEVEEIAWQYTLKPNTLPIRAYRDSTREYEEIHALQVQLRDSQHARRIAEIVHRTIPYPLLLVLETPGGDAETPRHSGMMSLAPKRMSQASHDAIVAETFYETDWIDPDDPSSIQRAFLESLDVSQLPQTDFYTLYEAWIERVDALQCAQFSGQYRIETDAERQERRRRRLARCHELKGKIENLRTAIRKEHQFNRQMELNGEIKRLEAQLKEEVDTL